VRAAQRLPGRGVAALEHGLEPRRRCFAPQPSDSAPAPYRRPGDSPWPERYVSWSVASSRVSYASRQPTTWRYRPPPRCSAPRHRWRERTQPSCIAVLG
jgi:hypothetical protein